MASALPIQRFPRAEKASNSIGSSSSSNISSKKWPNWLPLFIALVVIAEIAFLGRLDMFEKANSWADSFYQFTTSSLSTATLAVDFSDETGLGVLSGDYDQGLVPGSCEEWLMKEDSVEYSRDFDKEPVFVRDRLQELNSCSIGCKFVAYSENKVDAAFWPRQQDDIASVLRSMESPQYYPENNITLARRWKGI